MKLDDATSRLLGWPAMSVLKDMFLEAVEGREDGGVSPREMAKRNPSVPLDLWMQAGAELHSIGAVSHSWRPVKDPTCSAAQESCYAKPVKDEVLG